MLYLSWASLLTGLIFRVMTILSGFAEDIEAGGWHLIETLSWQISEGVDLHGLPCPGRKITRASQPAMRRESQGYAPWAMMPKAVGDAGLDGAANAKQNRFDL
jgi:hypothetical protein